MSGHKSILSIKTKVLKILSSQIKLPISEKIFHKDLKYELGLKTSKKNKIIRMIEKLYNIPILKEDCEKLNTINDFILFIEKRQTKEYIVKRHTKSNSKD